MMIQQGPSAIAVDDGDRIADELFDALTHFEGELPDVETLAELTDLATRIVCEDDTGAPQALQRDAWLLELISSAMTRREEGLGFFVVERRRTRRLVGGRLVVRSLYDRIVTRGDRVVSQQRGRCSLTIAFVSGNARVTGLEISGAVRVPAS